MYNVVVQYKCLERHAMSIKEMAVKSASNRQIDWHTRMGGVNCQDPLSQ